MEELYIKRNIMCIDLKSFFASCECIDRGLDPFKVPLVVANKKQGNGAITLAVTPALKKQGVPSRVRLFDIPPNIKYEIVPPRMKLYIEKSKEVVNIYLDYVAPEDLHIYSVDECFLDVTDYLKLYKKNDYELAEEILKTIERKTGLTATCGIGPNLLLAKVAMDTEAKKYKNGIAKWTYEDIPEKLWPITPLSKMWGIGPRMEKNLNNLNIYTIRELAHYNKNVLKDKFGVMGLELWNHANGIDTSKISDFKVSPKDKSYSHSQVLFKDYNETNVKLIIASKEITNICFLIFDRYYNNLPIRKVSISCGGLTKKSGVQLNLFDSIEEKNNEVKVNTAIDEIKARFGKNSIVKASSLLPDSTAIERNKKIGGHHE